MDMPNRTFGGAGRYGFNGKERDKDMHSLTAYDYGFRIYNPAIGKFLSVDPLTKSYPELTPYQYASNRPIDGIDLDGLEVDLNSFMIMQYRGTTKFEVTGEATIKLQILNLSAQSNKDLNISSYSYDVKNAYQDLLNKGKGTVFNQVYTKFGVAPGKGTSDEKAKLSENWRFTEWSIKINFTVEAEVIDSRDKIKNDAFLLVLVDDYVERPSTDIEGSPMLKPVGVSNGRGVATVKQREMYGAKRLHTVLHELAHAMGLSHFWNKKPGDRNQKNLLEYYDYANNELTSTQYKSIFQNYGLSPARLIKRIISKVPLSKQTKEETGQLKHENKEGLDSLSGVETSR
jgi:RHS repeat-associated protein